jgi:flagellar L-ring protein precursor FlgH
VRTVLARTGLVVLLAAIHAGVVHADSLYSEARYQSLVEDHRSLKMGQSVTVLILEQASAAASADTEADKSVAVAGGASADDSSFDASLDLSNQFDGGATTSRAGRLIARVSVVIVEVLPGGELRVEGEQVIEFNDEKQQLRVAGVVRPADISADNTVLSTRLANAEITYVGDGILGSRQEPGVVSRFFNWLF